MCWGCQICKYLIKKYETESVVPNFIVSLSVDHQDEVAWIPFFAKKSAVEGKRRLDTVGLNIFMLDKVSNQELKSAFESKYLSQLERISLGVSYGNCGSTLLDIKPDQFAEFLSDHMDFIRKNTDWRPPKKPISIDDSDYRMGWTKAV